MAKVTQLNAANEAVAKAILAQQGDLKQWAQKEHNYAVRNAACAILTPLLTAAGLDASQSAAVLVAFRPAFLIQLQADGFGGNASQFRQKLAALGHVPAQQATETEGYD